MSKVSKFPADAGTGHGIFGRLKNAANIILNSRYKNQKKFEFYIATVQIKHDNNVLFIKPPQIFGSKFLVQIILDQY
ncbi:unnamed protein product [Rhizophagus irregularis]|nr:unnamed protein product [Rhizophagus irregularis]